MTYHASIRGIVPETCPAIDRVGSILFDMSIMHNHAELIGTSLGLSLHSKAEECIREMEKIRFANATLRDLAADALRIIARQDELLKKVPTELLERIGT